MRGQNVIQRRDKAPEEEQNSHHGESGEIGFVASLPCGRRARRRAYVWHKLVRHPFKLQVDTPGNGRVSAEEDAIFGRFSLLKRLSGAVAYSSGRPKGILISPCALAFSP